MSGVARKRFVMHYLGMVIEKLVTTDEGVERARRHHAQRRATRRRWWSRRSAGPASASGAVERAAYDGVGNQTTHPKGTRDRRQVLARP
jgi:hypothetical protein